MIEINSKQSFDEVVPYFEISAKKAYQMDRQRTGYTTFEEVHLKSKSKLDLIIGKCDYKARSGVEFTPAEVYFIAPEKKGNKKHSYLFSPAEFKNSKYKSLTRLPVQLETTYVKPVIKAPDIKPFGFIENNSYCIFPYNEGVSTSVEANDLVNNSPDLFSYLTINKKTIGKQSKRSLTISRGNAFYSLSKVGPYTFAPHLVTFRDNTKLSAAVVNEIKTPWGEKKMPVCAKHCPYISQDKAGRYITEDEAFYLCGILNTEIVGQYFKSTYSGRSYSINFNIKMPRYDPKNQLQVKLMQLARKATKDGVSPHIYSDLEKSYLALCSETK